MFMIEETRGDSGDSGELKGLGVMSVFIYQGDSCTSHRTL